MFGCLKVTSYFEVYLEVDDCSELRELNLNELDFLEGTFDVTDSSESMSFPMFLMVVRS